MTPRELASATADLERLLPAAMKVLFERAEDPLRSLSIGQVRIVRALAGGSKTVSQLAEEHHLTQGAISQQLKGLCSSELLLVATDPEDRRVKHLQLSAKGKALMEKRTRSRRRAAAEVLEALEPGQLEALVQALSELVMVARSSESSPETS